MPKPYFDFQQSGEQADIYIFGDITSFPCVESDVSAFRLARQLEQSENLAEINIHVDSYGGEVSEGFAIYNAIRNKNAHVKTYADGFVASAAIYPFLAGDERVANNVSAFYFHPVIGGQYGYAEDLREAADELDKLTEIGLGAFTAAGMKEQAARDLINSKTWYAPEAVLEMGLATSIQKQSDSKTALQSVRSLIVRQMLAVPAPPAKKPEEKKSTLFELFAKI
nr:MAG TPA: Putative ATP dependent Clp protease [Caudoviricetes sp.]